MGVDLIYPRSKGCCDEPWNLQSGCPFCELGERAIIANNALAVLIHDRFPATAGHLLVVPRRHVADFFELRRPEQNAISDLLEHARSHVLRTQSDVSGFNWA